jgi:hypothetical protein
MEENGDYCLTLPVNERKSVLPFLLKNRLKNAVDKKEKGPTISFPW